MSRIINNKTYLKTTTRKVKAPKRKQTQLRTTVFTSRPQPRFGKLSASYRQFLNTRKQRLQSAAKKKNPKAMDKMINPYIQCRLSPFTASNGLGIPDDTDAKRLVVDHRQITSFKMGSSGSMNIVVAPTIPQIVWFQTTTSSDTTYTVNGDHPTTHNGDENLFHPITITQYQNMLLTRNDAAGLYNTFPTYLNAMRARIVTIGYRIIYTGSTMNNSGSIMLNKLGMSLQPPIGNASTFSVYNGHGGTDLNYNVNQVLVQRMNLSKTFDTIVSDTVRVPLRQGVQGLLKHASSDYKWCDVTDNENYLCSTLYDNLSLFTQGLDRGPDYISQWPSVQFADDQWSPAAISIRGATEGQTFDLETVFCIEYIPNLESESASLAKQPPKISIKSVETGAAYSRDLPLGGTSSIFTSAVKAASALAPMLL